MNRNGFYRVVLVMLIVSSITVSPVLANSNKLKDARESLEQETEKLQELQNSQQDIQDKVRTLQDELDFYDSEIASSESELEATSAQIEGVKGELSETRAYLDQLEKTIRAQKDLLESYMNSLYIQPEVSLFEIFLSNNKLSDMVGAVEKSNAMQDSIGKAINLIEAKEQEIISERQHLFDKEEQLVSLKRLQEDQVNLLKNTQEEKAQILAQYEEEQEATEVLLAESLDKKSDLLSTIRVLTGSDGNALTLEEAYNLATVNAARLGGKIRPEFLVGVMKVESGLGGNVGGFYYKDALSGCAAQPGNTTKLNYMREERAFEQLVGKLNLSVTQPVSGCPYPHYIGTGGAMGPAQVMPSTWLGYEARLAQMKGAQVNPWNVEDAMLAMGMILLGKIGNQDMNGNESLERRAAMCYVGGCKHGWYADRVMNEANRVKELLGS